VKLALVISLATLPFIGAPKASNAMPEPLVPSVFGVHQEASIVEAKADDRTRESSDAVYGRSLEQWESIHEIKLDPWQNPFGSGPLPYGY
jgi:hypothetical protein